MSWLLSLLLLMAQQDSPLVQAAKAAGGPRKPTGKVITNADVAKAATKAPAAPPADTKTPSQIADEQRRTLAAATARAEEAEKKVAELEAELRRIELAYYEESDLDRRDTVVVAQFNETKARLAAARKELADAKEALRNVTPSVSEGPGGTGGATPAASSSRPRGQTPR